MKRLTTESSFIFRGQYFKQIDGCTMGGPLSVILSDIYMTKLEETVVIPAEPKFCKRFIDDTFNIRKKDTPGALFLR